MKIWQPQDSDESYHTFVIQDTKKHICNLGYQMRHRKETKNEAAASISTCTGPLKTSHPMLAQGAYRRDDRFGQSERNRCFLRLEIDIQKDD